MPEVISPDAAVVTNKTATVLQPTELFIPEELTALRISTFRDLKKRHDTTIHEDAQLNTLRNRSTELGKICNNTTASTALRACASNVFGQIRAEYTGQIGKIVIINFLKDNDFNRMLEGQVNMVARASKSKADQLQAQLAELKEFYASNPVYGKTGKEQFIAALRESMPDDVVFTSPDDVKQLIIQKYEDLTNQLAEVEADIELYGDQALVDEREQVRVLYLKYRKEVYADSIPHFEENTVGITGLGDASVSNIMRFTKEQRLSLTYLQDVVHELFSREAFTEAKQLIEASPFTTNQNHPLRTEYETALSRHNIRQKILTEQPKPLEWHNFSDQDDEQGAAMNYPRFVETKEDFPVDAFDGRYIATTGTIKTVGASAGRGGGEFAFVTIPGIEKDFYYRVRTNVKQGDKVAVKLGFHQGKWKTITNRVNTRTKYIGPRIMIDDISLNTPFEEDIPQQLLGILSN